MDFIVGNNVTYGWADYYLRDLVLTMKVGTNLCTYVVLFPVFMNLHSKEIQ